MDARTAFSDSNDVSGGSTTSTCCVIGANVTMPPPRRIPPGIVAINRLSEDLESIFFDNPPPAEFEFFADARLIVESGREVPVHRCILSARSAFFKNLFMSRERNAKLDLNEMMKDRQVGYDSLMAVLGFIYRGRIRVSPKNVCVCMDDQCSHLACRPAISFMVEVLYASFVFQINELVSEYQRDLLNVLDKATADDVLMVLSVAQTCSTECASLLERSIEIVVKSDLDIITLDKALPHLLVEQIEKMRMKLGFASPEINHFPDKHIKRIYRALESDDVELVRMLLKEEHTDLDDAYALHYAVAYCDSKTTTELLDLVIADVNHRNPRGHTVLHVAAMRKDPKIIVSLLIKGARPSDLTSDGRKAVQIARRLTRPIDYYKNFNDGTATPKDRLCIEILEQAERRDPLLGEASASLAMAGDDLRRKLLYLENRVALAKLLFPMEAKVAMDIAQVDETSEFKFINRSFVSSKRTSVDLNEAPFRIQEEHLCRLKALSKAVELGKRLFPRCSVVLNKIMGREDYPVIADIGNEECPLKRKRRMEIQEDFSKAFTEDKEEFDRILNLPSCSSSSAGKMKERKW